SAGNGSDHNGAGFCLPPRINDGAATVTDDFAVPHPGFGIDGLTNGAEQAQAGQLVLLRPFISPFDKGSNRRGCRVKDIYLVAIDDAPETVGLGIVGRTFIHQAGSAILQGSVDDVAVTRNPTDVGCAPVGVFLLQVENPLGGQIGANRVAAGG